MSDSMPVVLIAEDNPGLARVLSFKFKSCWIRSHRLRRRTTRLGSLSSEYSRGGNQRSRNAAHVRRRAVPKRSSTRSSNSILFGDRPTAGIVDDRDREELNITKIFGKPFSPADVIAAVSNAIKESERFVN